MVHNISLLRFLPNLIMTIMMCPGAMHTLITLTLRDEGCCSFWRTVSPLYRTVEPQGVMGNTWLSHDSTADYNNNLFFFNLERLIIFDTED